MKLIALVSNLHNSLLYSASCDKVHHYQTRVNTYYRSAIMTAYEVKKCDLVNVLDREREIHS